MKNECSITFHYFKSFSFSYFFFIIIFSFILFTKWKKEEIHQTEMNRKNMFSCFLKASSNVLNCTRVSSSCMPPNACPNLFLFYSSAGDVQNVSGAPPTYYLNLIFYYLISYWMLRLKSLINRKSNKYWDYASVCCWGRYVAGAGLSSVTKFGQKDDCVNQEFIILENKVYTHLPAQVPGKMRNQRKIIKMLN